MYFGCQEDPNCCQVSTRFPLPAATTEPSDESETAAGAVPEDWSVAINGGGEGGLGSGDGTGPEISKSFKAPSSVPTAILVPSDEMERQVMAEVGEFPAWGSRESYQCSVLRRMY